MNSIIYQFLNEPRRIRKKIEGVDAKIEDLRTTMLPGAIRYDKDNVMVSPEDHMIDYAIRLEPLTRERDRLLTEYQRAYQDVVSASACLSDKQKAMILMKHIEGMSNTEMAEAYGISRRNVIKLCNRAYDKILDKSLRTLLKYDIV